MPRPVMSPLTSRAGWCGLHRSRNRIPPSLGNDAHALDAARRGEAGSRCNLVRCRCCSDRNIGAPIAEAKKSMVGKAADVRNGTPLSLAAET